MFLPLISSIVNSLPFDNLNFVSLSIESSINCCNLFSHDNSLERFSILFAESTKFLIAFLQNSLNSPSLRSNPICPSGIMIGLRPSTKSV